MVTSPPYFQLRDYQCGEGQIGLEATPEAYIAALVEVFREVWRVLRHDGVLWLVLGDSYWGTRSSQRGLQHTALKPKDLIGIPWRVALALHADGWYLLRGQILATTALIALRDHAAVIIMTLVNEGFIPSSLLSQKSDY